MQRVLELAFFRECTSWRFAHWRAFSILGPFHAPDSFKVFPRIISFLQVANILISACFSLFSEPGIPVSVRHIPKRHCFSTNRGKERVMCSSIGVKNGFVLLALGMMSCLCVLVLNVSVASALDEMSWAFQSTGFVAAGNPGPQTAIAMRDGQIWPVVFSETQNQLQAYSLYPVTNPTVPNTNWFQIGTNLLQDPSAGLLSAATSPDGRFGAVLRRASGTTGGQAIVGASPGGFGSTVSDVQAIDFDKYGNLIKGTASTLPVVGGVIPGTLIDIAASPTGDLGAVDSNLRYYQKIAMAGVWGFTDLKQAVGVPYLADSVDLAMDSVGRPHIVGMSGSALIATDFDVATGLWKTQTLANNMASSPFAFGATVASDSRGRVGAAWVEPSSLGSANGSLMYAYKDGSKDWVTQTVATYITLPRTTEQFPIKSVQGVGLAFDAENLPVISFTGADNKIWVAYDPLSPIASVPEPCTLLILASGGIFMLVTIGKSKWRRR
jgi:hypothetical protein